MYKIRPASLVLHHCNWISGSQAYTIKTFPRGNLPVTIDVGSNSGATPGEQAERRHQQMGQH